MILNLKSMAIKILLPKAHSGEIDSSIICKPFSDEIINELSYLSVYLMTEGRATPSIVAVGYWLRESHIRSIKSEYLAEKLQAKGLVFHIAPGNVDTLFFYSIIISILCGNQSLLRISNRLGNDAQLLLDLLNKFFSKMNKSPILSALMTVIQYNHDDQITAKLSALSSARVIWGNDYTIEQISQFPLFSDAAVNICFPNRYSVAIININNEDQIKGVCESLLRDIKPYSQQACSSPKVLYWLNTAQSLQEQFYKILSEQLNQSESLEANDLISQLLYLQRLPLLVNSTNESQNKCLIKQYDLLKIAELKSVPLECINEHIGLWILLSVQIDSLDQIRLFEHCQTVTVDGIEKPHWSGWEKETEQPMKRIVTAGQALAFSHVWDGIDLVQALTNK